ncbi:MAG: hypothetical protein ACRENX_12460 [Candidatus Dormibacteria bacterium]
MPVPAKLATALGVRSHVLNNSERSHLAEGVKSSQKAAGLLTVAIASLAAVDDSEVIQMAQEARDAMDRLQERMQLLADAYRIADRHRAADGIVAPGLDTTRAEPVGLGSVVALAQTATEAR